MTALLSIERLRVSYGAVQALRDADLAVAEGEIVALLGMNGAGKSSLLKTVSGLVRPSDGEIRFRGELISLLSPLAIVQRGVVLCPEGRELFPTLSVLENLKLGALRTGLAWRDLRPDYEALIALFPVIAQRLRQTSETLSGGEQQMVAIARAVIARPQLLLLDEPSLGVAPIRARQIFANLRSLGGQNRGILVVEQNARLALSIADRAYVIKHGEIVRHGTSREISSYLYGDGVRAGEGDDSEHRGAFSWK